MNLLEHVHKRDTKIVRDLDHLSCMKRLRMLALFNLEKRKLKGYFVAAFQYLKGIYKKDGNRQFSRAHCNRTRGNGFKLKKRYIYLRLKEEAFVKVGGEMLVAQRRGGFSTPGNIQGQVEWALKNLV